MEGEKEREMEGGGRREEKWKGSGSRRRKARILTALQFPPEHIRCSLLYAS